MTYCVAMRLKAGLVFLSDSRTNAGVDHVSTFRKMSVFENPGERMLVMMTAGNLSISQSIKQIISEHTNADGKSIWNATSMYEAAQIVGAAIRLVYERDASALQKFGIDFNVGIIFGGQIKGERCRLFQIYSAGNFIEAHDENPYFQIGESKYGKPIIDRVLAGSEITLDQAAKCALISMDSTLRSNLSVGLPLDLLVYESGQLALTRFVTIDSKNEYFKSISSGWSSRLREVFDEIEDPVWHTVATAVDSAALKTDQRQPLVTMPKEINWVGTPAALQTLAQNDETGQK
ncbi:peptidase [Glaciimonas sp. Gout2]|uniref:peptidase n=2 Tax=Glaciimonas TaxID=1229970 RepID=UPI002AB48B37|nr:MULTISPECIES: peptidase [unclassified Glaciimonas]MDY7545577.1 peptidase [Glaciimonas sp. CA11.2]MEB0012736.1 peptidase [Glaciimonas sp. Cout2]MEB0082215.1 peptidase [Glaciimonas sp. Gout2]